MHNQAIITPKLYSQIQSTSTPTQYIFDEKTNHSIASLLKKLESINSVKQRASAAKELDQLIQKMQTKINRSIGSLNNIGTPQTTPKLEFPYCLSVIIVKTYDIILNKDTKKEYKTDVENLIMRCLMMQRCLVYKFPLFILNFMESYQDHLQKLYYIDWITNGGQQVEPSFTTQIFITLLKLIDPTLKTSQHTLLSLLKNIFDYKITAFTEPQLLSLLIRISLVGIHGLSLNFTEDSTEVFQIIQYLLKYIEYSPKLLSISLMTLCILSNREPLTQPIWMKLKLIIQEEGNVHIFQEILDILQITLNCQYFDRKDVRGEGVSLNHSQAIRKEIQFKCFKDNTSMATELEDLQHNLFQSQAPTNLFLTEEGPLDTFVSQSMHELVCKYRCKMRQYDDTVIEEIIKAEKLSQNAFAFEKHKLQDLINTLQDDRNLWINTFEKNIDRVQKGAIFVIGKLLWSQDKIEEIYFPINHVLQIFSKLIKENTKFSVINEILLAVKQLVNNKQGDLYFEWEGILSILDAMTRFIDELINKKRIEHVGEIFKAIRNQIIVNQFPDFLEGSALKIYLKYKISKAWQEKTLTQLIINYVLTQDLNQSFQHIIDACLLKQFNQITLYLVKEVLRQGLCFQIQSNHFMKNLLQLIQTINQVIQNLKMFKLTIILSLYFAATLSIFT